MYLISKTPQTWNLKTKIICLNQTHGIFPNKDFYFLLFRVIPQLVYVRHHVSSKFASVPVHFEKDFQLHLLKTLQCPWKFFFRWTGTETTTRKRGVGRTLIVEFSFIFWQYRTSPLIYYRLAYTQSLQLLSWHHWCLIHGRQSHLFQWVCIHIMHIPFHANFKYCLFNEFYSYYICNVIWLWIYDVLIICIYLCIPPLIHGNA